MNKLIQMTLGLVAVTCAATPACSTTDGFDRCSPWLDTGCVGGPKNVQVCQHIDPHGACLSAYYQIGNSQFQCNSCGDCAQASNSAMAACLGLDAGSVIVVVCDCSSACDSNSSGGAGGAGTGGTASAGAGGGQPAAGSAGDGGTTQADSAASDGTTE